MIRRILPVFLGLSATLVLGCEGNDIAIFAVDSVGGGSSGAASSASGAGGGGGSAGALGMSGNSAAGQGGLDTGTGDISCSENSDCPGPGWVCTKSDCLATIGVCVPVPLFCSSDASPVCGCDDHVTYWNDCARQQAGECASSMGECGEGAQACDSSADCPLGAVCSHLLPPTSSCADPGPGNCWVTPSNGCPVGGGESPGGDPRRWMPCVTPIGGALPPCTSTCQAIQSGRPYQPLLQDAQCF